MSGAGTLFADDVNVGVSPREVYYGQRVLGGLIPTYIYD